MESQAKTFYIICTTPRSGSTMLCSLLENSSLAGRPNELFYEGQIADFSEFYQLKPDFESYFHGILRATTSKNGVFGFKLMYDHLAQFAKQLASLEGDVQLSQYDLIQKFFPSIQFIHLIRLNKVQQAISLTKANQTDVWWQPVHGSKKELSKELSYQVEEIHNYLRWIIEQDEGWQSFFRAHNIKPLTIYYENIKSNPQNAKNILNHLGITYPEDLILQTNTERQSNRIDKEWLVRYLYDRGYLTEEQRRFHTGS